VTLTPDRIRGFARVRQDLAYLAVKASYLRWRTALKTGFNPNQPRVPAGNPDGGQWTSTAGGGGSGTHVGVRDTVRRGNGPWHSVVTRRRDDGSIAQETALNRDGGAIRSEFSDFPDGTGFDERHTVLGPDGTLVTFQNAGSTQTIFGPDGQLLSTYRWSATGPEPVATVQPAFAPAIVGAEAAAAATIRLGLALYGWYLGRRERDRQPVIAFRARGYRRKSTTKLSYVGTLTREEVDQACPRQIEAQTITDLAAASTNRADYETPQKYGTAVHQKIRREINGPNPNFPRDPDFRAEVSLLKTQAASLEAENQEVRYGSAASIRVDILENTRHNTVCVYDIKTGRSGMSAARFSEIAHTVYRRFPQTQRIIVIEVRPSP
jgi:hypothetical protein